MRRGLTARGARVSSDPELVQETNCLKSSICSCHESDRRQASFEWFEDFPDTTLSSRKVAIEFIVRTFRSAPKEHLFVLYVDSSFQLKRLCLLCSGAIDEVRFRISDILRIGIEVGAAGFILIHNHPSGDPTPSQTDIRITRRIRHVSEELDLPLLDHVIISEDGVTSVGLW